MIHAQLKNRIGDTEIRSIAVFRALQLGDMLCSVPALRALRAAYPAARIALVGLPWAGSFVRRYREYIDDFIEFPGYPGLPETTPDIRRIPAFFAGVQACGFDLALQLHGSGSFVNPLAVLLGARMTAGFYLPGEYCPDSGRFMVYPEQVPEIWRYLQLLEFLGIPPQGDYLEFPLDAADRREFEQCAAAPALRGKPYVCIHPGARFRSRRWLAERFAEVADAVAGQGYTVVITGSNDETEIAARVQGAMHHPAVNLAGQTSLGAAAELIRGCTLLVSNDTGVSHIAAALKVPSVIVATGSDPRRWAPLDHDLHHVVAAPVSCRPCNYDACPGEQRCAVELHSCEVLSSVEQLLGKYGTVAGSASAEHGRGIRSGAAGCGTQGSSRPGVCL